MEIVPKKIFVLTGPESTGKTTLSLELADHFRTSVVPEFAREFLERSGPGYTEQDMHHMAFAQAQLIRKAVLEPHPVSIIDTDLLTYVIWFRERQGMVPDWIVHWSEHFRPTHYFLCKPDLPWAEDPLREHPVERTRLYTEYEDLLKKLGRSYSVVEGTGPDRFEKAIRALNQND